MNVTFFTIVDVLCKTLRVLLRASFYAVVHISQRYTTMRQSICNETSLVEQNYQQCGLRAELYDILLLL